MRVTALSLYPVKSLGGVSLEAAALTPLGLAGDRCWVLLDEKGNQVTASACHALLGLTAAPVGTAGAEPAAVRIAARDGASIEVEPPGPAARRLPSRISGVDNVIEADPAASRWISDRVGRPLTLGYQDCESPRPIGEPHGGRPGEVMSLADAGPILLTSEASVRQLMEWIRTGPEEVTADEAWHDVAAATERFRPNIVVDGEEAWAEDDWERVLIGDTVFRRGELCDRCVVTTIDRRSLRTGKEPIRTLARHRRWDGATWFGVRLIPELAQEAGGASIAVGDAIAVEGTVEQVGADRATNSPTGR